MFPDARDNEIDIFGRHALMGLYDKAKEYIQDPLKPAKQTLLYGPTGVGKSRLLAALTLVLLREGVCVIYIPDSSALKTDSVARYILKDALRVALPGAYHKRVDSLYLSSDFTTFMQSINEPCVLIADRWEAVPPDSMTSDVLTLIAYLYPTFYAARPIKPYYPGCSIGRMKDAIFRIEGLGAVRCSSNAIYIRVLNIRQG